MVGIVDIWEFSVSVAFLVLSGFPFPYIASSKEWLLDI